MISKMLSERSIPAPPSSSLSLSSTGSSGQSDKVLVENLEYAMRLKMKLVDNDDEQSDDDRGGLTSSTGDLHRAPVLSSRSNKVLLILDLNGILFERVYANKDEKPSSSGKHDTKLGNHYAWKRPGLEEFIKFVLSKFHIGVWSSARLENVNYMVEFAFPSEEQRKKIRFRFSQSDCSQIGFYKDKPNKPVFMKELKKVWEMFPNEFDKTNTLLIDDSIEKVALNPPYTAIHPAEWKREMQDDVELLPGGKIYEYLNKLSNEATRLQNRFNVQEYVKNNPFDSFGEN